MTVLSGWANFYVIVGSSAGALIGLQFVVMSLIANMPAVRANAQAGYAFSTPTVIHFGAATLLLLFIGIHNAWDAVTYHVFVKKHEQGDGGAGD